MKSKVLCKAIWIGVSILGVMVFFGSCNVKNNRLENADELAREAEKRKIVRMTEGDILGEAMKMGDSISMVVEQELKSKLVGAVKELGTAEALEYCNINAEAITSGFEDQLFTIKRISDKNRNPDNIPEGDIEVSLLEAYASSPKKHLPANIQVADGKIVYTRPIYTKQFCLQCHGNPGMQIEEATAGKIQELYPKDKAINYGEDEFRGVWVINFDKKKFIQQINVAN